MKPMAFLALMMMALSSCTMLRQWDVADHCGVGDTKACVTIAQTCDPESTNATDPNSCDTAVRRLMTDCIQGSQFACDFARQMCTEGSSTACDAMVSWQRWMMVSAALSGVSQSVNEAHAQRNTTVVLPQGYGVKAQQLQANCANLAERGLGQSSYSYSAGCGR